MKVNGICSQMTCRKPCPANQQQSGTSVKFGQNTRLQSINYLIKNCSEKIENPVSKTERLAAYKGRAFGIWAKCQSGTTSRSEMIYYLETAINDLCNAIYLSGNKKIDECLEKLKIKMYEKRHNLMYNYFK